MPLPSGLRETRLGLLDVGQKFLAQPYPEDRRYVWQVDEIFYVIDEVHVRGVPSPENPEADLYTRVWPFNKTVWLEPPDA